MVRQLRWATGVECPHCRATADVKNGSDETQDDRQRFLCRMCNRSFDDMTGTVFAGHHQPLSIWMLCLYFMGLNLSNRQIAAEFELNETSIQEMTTILRNGIVAQEPTITLEGTVECDEVYVIAGHKGHPESVKKGRTARKRRLKGPRGRGTAATDKPPIFGMIQRGGQVVLRVLENVQQATIQPVIEKFIKPGTLINTDEYNIYGRLTEWGLESRLSNFPAVNEYKCSPEKRMVGYRHFDIRVFADTRLFGQIEQITADLHNRLPPRYRCWLCRQLYQKLLYQIVRNPSACTPPAYQHRLRPTCL